MTIDTVFHDLSNETKAARICENHGASSKYWQCVIVSYLVSSYGLKLSFKKDCTPLCHIGVVTHSSSQENILHPPCPSLCLWCYVNAIIVVTYAMQTGLFPKNFPDGNPQFWERKWKNISTMFFQIELPRDSMIVGRNRGRGWGHTIIESRGNSSERT